jgi:hypothetical protein
MIRLLFLVHRYLGIGVGVLMVMWCLSGVVMMYVSYPDLDEGSRLRRLAPIDWSRCCKISTGTLRDGDPIKEFQVEMLAGRPVAYLRTGLKLRLVDLVTGAEIDRVSPGEAVAVAASYTGDALAEAPVLPSLIDYDQWTVSGSFNDDRPLYHFRLEDGNRSELYVSSATGRVVQLTTGSERFWNRLGSIPHWLYFSELRHRTSLWTQVVIATSMMGCFLAATGLFIGVRQLVYRPAGDWSPYLGFKLWHHIAGLIFGLFALTWVLSGLLSINPWGWLAGTGARTERAQLRGAPEPSGAQLTAALAAIAAAQPADVVSVEIAPLDGRLYFITSTARGERQRLRADALRAPLSPVDLAHIATILNGTEASHAVYLMTQEDPYYFSHHRDLARLPVYRMILKNGTRYYIDAISGMLVAKWDRSAQGYRWLHEALHRMDFTAALRVRPRWDVLMLVLMSGVTVLSATGTYLGYRRLR